MVSPAAIMAETIAERLDRVGAEGDFSSVSGDLGVDGSSRPDSVNL